MKFYNKYYSNYEELTRYYPRYYLQVREMDAILHAYGELADRMEADIEQTFLNCFIDTADESTIESWETFLGITTNTSLSLETRRGLIKAYIIGFGHLSATMIKQMVNSYTGTDVDVVFEPFDEEGNNRLYITIIRDEDDTIYMTDIMTLLGKKIPAHIVWLVNNRIEIYMDNMTAEQMILKNIRFHMTTPFWDCRIFDGTWYLDGSVLLDARRRYGALVGIKYKYGGAQTEESAALKSVRFRWQQLLEEKPEAGITNRMAVDFWRLLYFDGDWLLNGEYLLDHKRGRVGTAITMRTALDNAELEAVDNITVETKTRDYWFLDGAYALDGSKSLNSIYRKEVAE